MDNTGSVPANTLIYFTDELTPSGLTYTISVVAPGGGLIWGAESIAITGSSFNLNNAVPTTLNVLLSNPIVTNPSALQTITGFALADSIGFQAGDGSATVPSYSFTSSTGTGFFQYGAGNMGWASGGTAKAQWAATFTSLVAGYVLAWNSGAGNSALDAGLSRTAAATIAAGNGTQGDVSGTLQLASITSLTGQITPNAAGGIDVGTSALPFSGIRIGAAATNNARITGTFAAARVMTVPDVASDTFLMLSASQSPTNKTFDTTSNVGLIKITDTTLGAPAASITFSSIPGTYRSLKIIFNGRSDRAAVNDVAVLQFNGDTAANYDAQNIQGNNVTASAASSTGQTVAGFGQIPGANSARANIAGSIEVTIPNYAGTTFEKSFTGLSGSVDSTAANSVAELRAGSWRSTAAITSIVLKPNLGTNFTTGTRATLYGVN